MTARIDPTPPKIAVTLHATPGGWHARIDEDGAEYASVHGTTARQTFAEAVHYAEQIVLEA